MTSDELMENQSNHFTMASEGRDVEFAENVVDYVNRVLHHWMVEEKKGGV